MRRIALIGAALIASLAMTVSASARLGMATDIWAAAGAVTTTDGAEVAAIITDGIEAAVTTSIAGSLRWIRLRHPIARAIGECSGANGSRPRGAAGSASRMPMGAQPSPISTAIRIRSE